MFKIFQDYKERKTTHADLLDPKILAAYALDDPDFHVWLIDSCSYMVEAIQNSNISIHRSKMITMIHKYRKALDIIKTDLLIRGDSPRVTE